MSEKATYEELERRVKEFQKECSEHRRAKELLRESEGQFLLLAEQSLMAIGIIQDGVYKYFNKAYEEISGYSADEIRGWKSFGFSKTVHPDDLDFVADQIRKKQTAHPDVMPHYSFRGVRKNGEIRWIELYSKTVTYKSKPADLVMFIDITERMKAEESLREREEETKRLAQESAIMAEIGRIISSTLAVDEAYGAFAQEVRKLIPFDRIGISIVDVGKGTGVSTYMAGKDVPDREVGIPYSLEGTAIAEMMRARSTVLVQTNDPDEVKDRFPKLLSTFQAGFRSIMNVPLFSKGQIIGALLLRSVQSNAYAIKDLQLAERVGRQIAGAIANARLYVERKRAEEALRRSEQRMAVMSQIANVFLTMPDEEMYSEVLGIVLKVLESPFGTFGFIDESGDLVIPSMTRGIWDKCRVPGKSIVFPAHTWGHSLWGKAITERRAHLSFGPFHTPEGHVPIDGFLTVPVVFRDETIGVVSVANKEGGFTEEDKDQLESIALNISPILHARLHRERQERERKGAEEALRNSEAKYRELVQNANSIILRMDMRGNVTFFNEFAQRFFGYPESEILGKNVIGTIVPETDSAGRDLRAMIQDIGLHPERYANNENENMRHSGERVFVSWANKGMRDAEGKLAEVLCIGNDITQRKNLEVQLQQAQKMETIGTLAGGIAHDFNNILGAIMGYAELAQMDLPRESRPNKSLGQVLAAANRAKDLVKQILAFSRQSKEERKPIDVPYIVKEVLKFMRASLPATVEIREDLAADTGNILADPVQIHQVLMNLCTNAHHAMREKGGVLEVRLSSVHLHGEGTTVHPDLAPGTYVKLTVRDAGHGMDQAITARIFDPYFTTKEKGVGTGLGLAVVHGIVKDHGGAITVQSEPGKGSTFDVYFPLIQAEAIDERAIEEEVPIGHGRILFIDDEQALVEIARQILESLGYTVDTRTSSTEAMELFKKQPDRYDIVITDMTMPNLTGDKLALELIRIRHDIPVILCTGYSEAVSEEKAKKIGIKAFVMKPLVRAEIAKKIQGVLEE